MKKLMLLGGIRYLLPAIKAAHNHNAHVITADYLPDNIAHKYSDEYHNLNIIDKEAVLTLAKELKIDGILSYAVDPGVVTAAYVAEQMNLPFSCTYEAACILQNKSLFRCFLKENNFNVPNAKGYTDVSEALKDIDFFNWPVIVKPVDSAGSKGVTRVDNPDDLNAAVWHALEESHNGHFIIEDFLEKEGPSSGAESFFVDGELRYNAFYDQWFDVEAVNPYTPSAEIWPSEHSEEDLNVVRRQLQRLSDLLGFRTGLFNVEWRKGKDGKVYLMEVSPRAGGNRLAEMLNYATDIDIIDAEISKALSEPLHHITEPRFKGFYCILVLHSRRDGIFQSVEISNDIDKYLLEREIRISAGEKVVPFSGANNAIGTLFMKFSRKEDLQRTLSTQEQWMKVLIKN